MVRQSRRLGQAIPFVFGGVKGKIRVHVMDAPAPLLVGVDVMKKVVVGHPLQGAAVPIVVVGNKTDLPREISKELVEAKVRYDWGHGYVECCAKDNINITAIFRELLIQAKSRLVCRVSSSSQFDEDCLRFDFTNPASCGGGFLPGTPFVMRRRQSLPQVRSNNLQYCIVRRIIACFRFRLFLV